MASANEIIEKAKKTGKIEKGTNEVTKAIERGTAKFVVIAEDVQPKEITQHLAVLCTEKNIPFATVDSKKNLGISAGINVSTASVAVVDAGEAAGAIASFKTEKSETKPAEKAKESQKPVEAAPKADKTA